MGGLGGIPPVSAAPVPDMGVGFSMGASAGGPASAGQPGGNAMGTGTAAAGKDGGTKRAVVKLPSKRSLLRYGRRMSCSTRQCIKTRTRCSTSASETLRSRNKFFGDTCSGLQEAEKRMKHHLRILSPSSNQQEPIAYQSGPDQPASTLQQ
ncbi:hypothetical protein CF319_g7257 [Tilletia indica]|nr:hypothetical protein CF319_g7257 [Tilletia indica]